ncbi:unnamed protein product [Durusdinium trenchii]|uniref:Uncharacterized protein n=1 Tax=Durusdinium trenchii TaxID=1381693 RepID=A0ABP0QLC1_9DINO
MRRQQLKTELVEEARQNGFLSLPEKPLQADEALSKHYLELQSRPLSWQRPQDVPPDAPLPQHLVQPRVLPRPWPPENQCPARLRESLQTFSLQRRFRPRTSEDLIQLILDDDDDEDGDLFDEESSEEASEVVTPRETSKASEEFLDPRSQMLMSIAESLVKDILPGSLVSAKVQDELSARIWRETRALSLDSVAPLSFIAKALAPKHSLWQIELAIKVITFNLAQRERQELSQVGMRQDQFDDFIQDMQKGITSTHAEVKRFDSYAGGSAYQRICVMLKNAIDSPEGPCTEQELLLRSIRDSVQHLTIVKKSVDDASRLLHEAKMAETGMLQWSSDLPRTKNIMDKYFSDLNALKEKTSSKLKDDFQVAGQRFEQILNETTQLHRMATDHEVKTSQIQGELELKDEELRELQEKLRRMKQGTDRNKSEYQACKQDLEDERDTVVTRVKAAERLFDGQTQEIESLHQDLRNLLLEEVAKQMEEEALRKFEKVKADREEAQVTYQNAQDRLRLTEDLLDAMNAATLSGNIMDELLRKRDEINRLRNAADKAEEFMADQRQKLVELQQWLRDFGQPEVAEAADTFITDATEMPKVALSTPMQLVFILERLVPRWCRRVQRREALRKEVTSFWCPSDAYEQQLRERSERWKLLLSRVPETQQEGEAAYGSGWRWRLLQSSSAPELMPLDTSGASPVRSPSLRRNLKKEGGGQRASQSRSGASPPRDARRKSAVKGRQSLEAPTARGPLRLEAPEGRPPWTWAAAPGVRWEVQNVPYDRWESAWRKLWIDAKKIFEAVPPDALTDEGVPVIEGELGIAHFWQDCHLHLRRLWLIISTNLRGLDQLKRLESTLKNAQKLLGDPLRAKRKKIAGAEEDKEERELQTLSTTARQLLEHGREVFNAKVQLQQDQMWFCASLLAQLRGLREALMNLLGRLKTLSEEHEDCVFSGRLLAEVSKLKDIPLEVPPLLEDLQRWGRSLKLDFLRLTAEHQSLEEEWQSLVGQQSDSFLTSFSRTTGKSKKDKVVFQVTLALEEAITALCAAYHCLLENRWIRKQVTVGRLLDWRSRFELLKAGDWSPLQESAKSPSKVRRTNTASSMSRVRSRNLEGVLAELDQEEAPRRSPDLEEVIAELMAQMVRQQDTPRRKGPFSRDLMSPMVSESDSPGRPTSSQLSNPRRAVVASMSRHEFFLDDELGPDVASDHPEDAGGDEPDEPGLPSRSSSHRGDGLPSPSSSRRGRGAILLADTGDDLPSPSSSRRGRGAILLADRGDDPPSPMSSRGGDDLGGSPSPPSSRRGVTFEDLLSGDESDKSERSFLAGVEDEVTPVHVRVVPEPRDSPGSPASPASPSTNRSSTSLRRSKAQLFEETFAELMQKRLDSARSPAERQYQADLMESAYKEVRKTLSESDPFFFQEEDVAVDELQQFPEIRGLARSQSASSDSGNERARPDSEVLTSRISRTISGNSLVKSRSWAQAGSLGRTPSWQIRAHSRFRSLRLPRAVRVEAKQKPTRQTAVHPFGRRRLMPLLLPWKPEDPHTLHLGELGEVKGHEAQHVIAPFPAAPMQSVQDQQMKREALVNQDSRAATPIVESAQDSVETQRRAVEEVMLPPSSRPSSRPCSAQSVKAAGQYMGLLVCSERPETLLDESSSSSKLGQVTISQELPVHGLRRYLTPEQFRARLEASQAEAPSKEAERDYQQILQEDWTPIDKEKLDVMLQEAHFEEPLPRVAIEKAAEELRSSLYEALVEDANKPGEEEAYLDAPLDEALMRPATPAWLQEIVRPDTANQELCPSEPENEIPLSEFTVKESPESWLEGTPSPWEIKAPSAEQVLSQVTPENPSAPCSSRASTGTPRAFVAQGQRCRSASAQDTSPVTLPAIHTPVPEEPRSEVTPMCSAEQKPRSHAEASKPQSARSGRQASHPLPHPDRADRRDSQALPLCSAELQRCRVEGPKPQSARGTGRKASPRPMPTPDRRESQASSMALAASFQQQLLTKMKGGRKTPAKQDDKSLQAWWNVLAGEPKVQRVLSQGLAAQLTSECSYLATSGKMHIPQRRFYSKG